MGRLIFNSQRIPGNAVVVTDKDDPLTNFILARIGYGAKRGHYTLIVPAMKLNPFLEALIALPPMEYYAFKEKILTLYAEYQAGQ